MENVGLTEDDIKENLIFDGSKPGSLMKIAMPAKDASGFFGAPAPDLTLESRIRNADWIYSYLKGFYSDDSRPMGVNNTIFKNVGMPNILWKLEGVKNAVYRYDISHDGHVVAHFETEAEAAAYVAEHPEKHRVTKVVDHLVTVKAGSMNAAEFDQVARDLSTYLSYIAEPEKLERQRMGVWVILFLSLFTFLAYLMKKEWWKEIH